MTIKSRPFPFNRHALALALALATGATNAATITITGDCTLVNAINNANTDTDTDGATGCIAGSGADTLALVAGSVTTLTAVNNNTVGPNGLPTITSPITITGNAPTIERSSASGTPTFRLFNIAKTGSLTLNNVKLTRGKITGFSGGAIRNEGIFSLINSTVTSNSTDKDGGAIRSFAGSTTTLTNTTISSNTASGSGGGIFSGGGLTVNNSMLFGNTAILDGGGISNIGNLKATNSSFSTNKAYYGGAIHNKGTLTITNSTLHNNAIAGTPGFGAGGGIGNETTMIVRNSIIANSVNGSDCNSIGSANLTGVNLVEDGSCGGQLSGDPALFARLNNGGTTLTHAIKASSPASNTALNSQCPPADQRAVTRPQPTGGACDIGAFELITPTPASVTDIVQFFDAELVSGAIISTDTGTGKPQALRNQLLTAGHFQDRALTTQACAQLTRTLPFIDPDSTPDSDDYVTGTEAGALADQVTALRTTWACP
ncbi:MAG: choice-of-anchor Q domain-containing protein [Methylococcaceae bacterium]